MEEAQSELASQATGAVLVRPSTRGASQLTATIKLSDDVYRHVDIIEEQKKHPWTIGKVLRIKGESRIGDESFDDLDELLARYIDPLVNHYMDAFAFRKYVVASREQLGTKEKNRIDGGLKKG